MHEQQHRGEKPQSRPLKVGLISRAGSFCLSLPLTHTHPYTHTKTSYGLRPGKHHSSSWSSLLSNLKLIAVDLVCVTSEIWVCGEETWTEFSSTRMHMGPSGFSLMHVYVLARTRLCQGLKWRLGILCVDVSAHVVFGPSKRGDQTASGSCLQGISRSWITAPFSS